MWNVIIGCSLILLGFITFGFFRAKSEKLHKQKREQESLRCGYLCMISLFVFFLGGIASFFIF